MAHHSNAKKPRDGARSAKHQAPSASPIVGSALRVLVLGSGFGAAASLRERGAAEVDVRSVESRAPTPAEVEAADIVIVDGGKHALTRVQQVRGLGEVPLMLIAIGAETSDILDGYAAGADDVVLQQLPPEVVWTRVGALMRRARGVDLRQPRPLTIGALTLDPNRLEASLDGTLLPLTSHEFRILYALAAQAGRICPRELLVRRVGGRAGSAFERAIDVHISRLRTKLGDDGRNPAFLKTVRGGGYVLVQPEPVAPPQAL